ncbi:MAG TPA: hypothetical protein PKW63_14695 [Vicinamibacterales bacterium]|nr:hypothetical protein [Acidobacteriota bacterium]HQX83011.1 hypothetical protein [Vicinamibacterales bacterium]
MRIVPGWVVGALGVGVVAGAFVLGGRLAASDLSPAAAVAVTSAPAPGLQVEATPYIASAPRMVRTSSVRTVSRAPVQRNRSTKKSVAIIAGSTAAGAIVGGVAKGKKGALIGGLIGGGAAAIWDQVTRRKGN